MTIPSIKYMVFLSATCLLNRIFGRKFRPAFLLLISWAFYAICQPQYMVLLGLGTVVCWLSALAYERRVLGIKKGWIVLGSAWFLSLLFFYKYLDFFAGNLQRLVGWVADGTAARILPLGISFYTFTALAYLFDVAGGKIHAERNYLNCALNISFFPSLLSGPINRAGKLLPQFQDAGLPSFQDVKVGLLRIAVGTAKKLVVANSLGRLVDAVYSAPSTAEPWVVALAVAVYSFQIYFDFSGYTDIALGSACLLGLKLAENFKRPYLGASVREFWRRWHISLTSWFRDYLYIPLGGSRVSRARFYLNIIIVFAVSGLWHGADWSFVLWGLLNGVFQVLEQMLAPVGDKLRRNLKKRENSALLKLISVAWTFALVSLAWVFFRADNITQAIGVFGSMVPWAADGTGGSGLRGFAELRPLALAALCVLVFGLFDTYSEMRGGDPLMALTERNLAYWLSLSLLTVFAAVFGVYGGGYDAGAFIYFQF